MATSSVARIMAVCLSIVWFLVALACGQSVQPSNATLPDDERLSQTQLKVPGGPLGQPTSYNLAPLTVQVGRGGNSATVSVC